MEKVTKPAKKWYGIHRDVNGERRWKPLAEDKRIAELMLSQMVLEVERARANLGVYIADKISIASMSQSLCSMLRRPRHRPRLAGTGKSLTYSPTSCYRGEFIS